MVAARITVFHEQQEIQEMGSVEATQHHTVYVFVSSKENIWLRFYYSSISLLIPYTLFCPYEFWVLNVAATRITVSLESSEEQQKVQGMGSVEATNKQRGTG